MVYKEKTKMNSIKITEQQNPNSMNIDSLDIGEILRTINNEDERVAKAVKEAIPQIHLFIESLVDSFWQGGRLFYVGAGTSGRLGVLDASECPPTFNVHESLVQGIIAGGINAVYKSVEGAEDSYDDGYSVCKKNNINSNDSVIGISANGSAPFVLGALKYASEKNAFSTLLTSNHVKQIDYIDMILEIITGPEIISGSTRMKAGTAIKMILNMISTTSMIKLNKTFGNLMVDLHASNEKLWDRGARIVSKITNLDYTDSLKLLQSANGDVKVAIVMNKLNMNMQDARVQIIKHKGSLRVILSSSS